MRKRIFSTSDVFKAGKKEAELLVKGYNSVDEATETHSLSPLEYLKFIHHSGSETTYELIWLE